MRQFASIDTFPIPHSGISAQPNNVTFHIDQDTLHELIAFAFTGFEPGFGFGEIIPRHTADLFLDVYQVFSRDSIHPISDTVMRKRDVSISVTSALAEGGSVTGTVTYYPTAGAMRIDSTVYYIAKDLLGSASIVANSAGVLQGDQRYYRLWRNARDEW